MMKPFQKQALDWQSPFVDIFKTFNAFDIKENQKGNLVDMQDFSIGRRIFKITGNVPAANYISLPAQGITMRLTGKYIYCVFQPHQGKYFNIYLDLGFSDREQSLRFSIGNLFDTFKMTKGNVLQIPFKNENQSKWTVLNLDIENILLNYGGFGNLGNKLPKGIYLKGVQICANLSIRGIYTSDNLYEAKNLPKEMGFKPLKEGQKWDEFYQYIVFPALTSQPQPQKHDNKENEDQENTLPPPEAYEPLIPRHNKVEKEVSIKVSAANFKPASEKSESNMKETSSKFYEKINNEEPLVKLKRVIGFSANQCPDIKWLKVQNYENELIYASGNLLVLHNIENNSQRFFLGHNEPIICIDTFRDVYESRPFEENYVVSAQEGKRCLIKIWCISNGVCVSTFQPPYISIKSLSCFSLGKYLCTVGIDQQRRESILIWNISEIETKKKPELLAKQISEFDIVSMKFSPTEADQLVSCGRENIRFWRIKADHLKGGAVVLNHHARNTVFTVLDFDFNVSSLPSSPRRLFVGSKSGLLYQVSYSTKTLESIYKVHESSICSLCLSQAFCMTGSEDCFLRVWPLDFSEYILEAKHESIVLSLDISQNGTKLSCGIANGGIGILDLANQSYKTMIRSHTEEILQLEIHEYSNSLISLSRDGSIRLWDLNTLEQNYEFSYPPGDPCTFLAGQPGAGLFIGGFESGIFRVFDIEKVSILEEVKYHERSIVCVKITNNGKYMGIGDKGGSYALYDIGKGYQMVKRMGSGVGIGVGDVWVGFNWDGELMGVVAEGGTHIVIWELYNLTQVLKLFCQGIYVKMFEFSTSGEELYVISTDCRIRVYGIRSDFDELQMEVFFLYDLPFGHRESIDALQISSNARFLFSGGNDPFLKLWATNDFENKKFDPFLLSTVPKNIEKPSSKIFLGHNTHINSICISPNAKTLFTAGGSEGIYVWDLKIEINENPKKINFDGLKPCARRRPDISLKPDIRISKEEENEKEIKEVLEGKEQEELLNVEEEEEMNEMKEDKSPSKSPFASGQKASEFKKCLVEEFQKTEKFNSVKVPNDFEPYFREYRKLKIRQPKEALFTYEASEIRKKLNLPFKHYFLEGKEVWESYQNKLDLIRENPKNIILQYLIGYNSDSHQNIVWNYNLGWFAYPIENMLIIEKIDKERSQKVINFPEPISVVLLSTDSNFLLVASAIQNSESVAPIYQMDCHSNIITKNFNYHTRGVQQLAISQNGKFLVSVGNFRENTVVVWDLKSGKMLCSSYTLDKINDVKISNFTHDNQRVLEFCTVGKDQVQFWAVVRDAKPEYRLEYYDVFVKKEEENEFPEITCCDYLRDGEEEFVICGTKSGEIVFVRYSTFDIVHRRKLVDSEIIDLSVSKTKCKIIFTAMDSNLHYCDYDNFNPENIHFSTMKLPSPACSISWDPEFNEGIMGTKDGSIYFLNQSEKCIQTLCSNPNPSISYKIFYINDKVFLTMAHSKNYKATLWSIDTGEELYTYLLKYPISSVFNVSNTKENKIFIFNDHNNEILILNLNKLGEKESYFSDEILSGLPKMEEKVISVLSLEKNSHILISDKGNAYVMSFTENKSSLIFKKIAQLFNDSQLICSGLKIKNNIFALASNDGIVTVYKGEKQENDAWEFIIMDRNNFFQQPHSSHLDARKENIEFTQILYENKKATPFLTKSKHAEGNYFVAFENVQYIYERNYIKRETTKRIPINGNPKALSCMDDESRGVIMAGLEDGKIFYFDVEDLENLTFKTFLSESITNIMVVKKRNKVIVCHENGIGFYNYSK